MSLGLVTLGIESPSVSGGGGGGGATGLRIPFELRDDDGVLTEGIDLSGAGVVQLSVNGAAFANRQGAAPTSVGDGAYYYETDPNDNIVGGWVLLKIEIAGYQKSLTREIISEPDFADVISAVASSQTALEDAINSAQVEIDSRIDDQTGTLGGAISALSTQLTNAETNIIDEIDTRPTLPAIVSGVAAQITTDHGAGSYNTAAAVDPNDFLNAAIEGGVTVADALRGLMSANIGKVTDFRTGVLAFKSLDGTKTRWTVTTDESGRISLVVGDLT